MKLIRSSLCSGLFVKRCACSLTIILEKADIQFLLRKGHPKHLEVQLGVVFAEHGLLLCQ